MSGTDYQANLGAGAKAADAAGIKAAADVAQLPFITVSTDHADKGVAKWEEERKKMSKYRAPGAYDEDSNSYAIAGIDEQIKAYIEERRAIGDANTAYGEFVDPGNGATKMLTKLLAEEKTINPDGRDLDKMMSPAERKAFDKAVKDPSIEPALRAAENASNAGGLLDAARKTLVAASQSYRAALTGETLTQLNTALTKVKTEDKALHDKIDKQAKMIATAVKVAAAIASGGVAAAGTAEAGAAGELFKDGMLSVQQTKSLADKAGKVGESADKIEGLAKGVLEIYHDKEFTELKAQAGSIQSQIQGWDAVLAKDKLNAAWNAFDGASTAYQVHGKKYQAALDARKEAYAKIGKTADQQVGNTGKNDKMGQVMLYIENIREAKSLLDIGKKHGAPAHQRAEEADKAMLHRSGHETVVKTNARGSYAGQEAVNDSGQADQTAIRQMSSLTAEWLKLAEDKTWKLDRQEAEAAKLFKGAGVSNDF